MSKTNIEKNENLRFNMKNKLILASYPLALGQFSHMATCGRSLENIGKMNLQSNLNKKIHHGIIQSRNLVYLVLAESL
jgi:hypothetical protein